jgi:hypothetical protein
MSVEEVAAGVEKTFGELDQARAAGLGEVADVNEARLRVLERDHKRLEDKLGATHPRVAALSRSLEFGKSVVAELRIEQAAAAMTPADVDERSWVLRGRVLNARRVPEKGMTVALYQGDVLQQQFGVATTDGNGHFVLRTTSAEAAAPQLSLRVLRDSRTIHVEDAAVAVRPGHSEFREIVLEDDGTIPTPPRGPREERRPPTDNR